LKEIFKLKEPKSLTEYRNSISKEDLKNIDLYNDMPNKDRYNCNIHKNNLRRYLLEEQGYICCYCMDRITCNNSKIEHFKPQTQYRENQLDYENLFVACLGEEGEKNNFQHCDTYKGEKVLNYINLLSKIESKVNYKKDKLGIVISSNDVNIDNDINKTLNLNIDVLKTNRKQTYNQVINKLKTKNFATHELKKYLNYYRNKNNGKFAPFSQMIIYFLEKKLKLNNK
jgi:uncharacterized protein (TIGR02646 family)